MGWIQKTARSLVVFAVLAATLPVSAEIYRWVDASGKMHFTQDLAKVPMRYRADSKARAEEVSKEIAALSIRLHASLVRAGLNRPR